MGPHIALLRGINVTGKNPLPMKELVAILEDLGSKNVRTYIQSGNAVFDNKGAATALSKKIAAEIKKRRGFEPHVLLLALKDLKIAIKKNPFPEGEDEPRSLHLYFCASKPSKPDLKALEAVKLPNERFKLVGNVFYLHAPDGIGRSKLAAKVEKAIGVPMTARNWRTVCKVCEMVTP